jgi:hypothetical protein
MAYEPRGKVGNLVQAMRAEPGRIWNSSEVATLLETAASSIPAFLDTALRHNMIFRKLENGRTQYSLTPFAPVVPPPQHARVVDPTWRPPQMVPPRGTPAPMVAQAAPAPTPAPLPAAPSAPPEPAPVLADASTPEAASAEVDEEPEVTWTMWEDGDIDLFGLVELENGGYRLPAEALGRLRKFVAWMPA